jgi:ribokinase
MAPKVTVVGSFAVGLTIRAPRLPVFGETIFGSDFDMGPGGKGSNQAVATARLGANSALVAMIGADRLAAIATDLYAAEGVDATWVEATDRRATGVGFIILNNEGANFIILDMGANQLVDTAFVDRAEERIAESDVVMAVLEVPVPAAARAMQLGRRHGIKTVLNPAPAVPLPDAIFPFIDYLTPNESELRILLGCAADDPRPTRDLARELRARGVGTLVVTLGDKGALVLTDEIEEIVPAIPVDVTDTTGAGDAFNSGFSVALAEGRDLIDAVRFGVVCGSLACTALGVVPSLARRDAADAAYADALSSVWSRT